MGSARPAIEFIANCSKGTYIRTLGEDIGEALGCGAHLTALRRIRTGDFDESRCVTLEALEAMNEEGRMGCLMPVDVLLPKHVPVTLDRENASRFLNGVRRRGDWPDAPNVSVYASSPRALLGTAQVKSGELIPMRLLSPVEVGQSIAPTQ